MGLLGPRVGRLYDQIGPVRLVIPGVVIVTAVLWAMTLLDAQGGVEYILAGHIVMCVGFALLSLNAGLRIEASQALITVSAVLFSILINVNSRVVHRLPALPLTAIQLTVVGILLGLVSALVEPWPARIGGVTLGWLAASVVLASILRFLLQVYAQGLTTPSHAAVILMLEAVWTALLAAAWYGETMSLLQFAGCGLIFAALLINRWYWVRHLVTRR